METTEFVFKYDGDRNFFLLDCVGDFSLLRFVAVIEASKKHLDQGHVSKIYLFDLRGADHDLDIFDLHKVAQISAIQLAGAHICVLRKKGHTSEITENTGVNRGLDLIVTESYSEAMDWIDHKNLVQNRSKELIPNGLMEGK